MGEAQTDGVEIRSWADSDTLRVAVVTWTGRVGGAETFTVELARALARRGTSARVVFVADPHPLAARLEREFVPYERVDLTRGRDVLLHPRRLARSVESAGEDVALLADGGYLAAALRLGGYPGQIIAVEHGTILQQPQRPPIERLLRSLDRASGIWACAAEVAVSDFVLDRLRGVHHPPRLVRIHNGLDLEAFHPAPRPDDTQLVVGCTARLIAAKGIDDLLQACWRPEVIGTVQLRIAGDGPELQPLERLADELGIAGSVEFLGNVIDVPQFWHGCDIAVVPSRFPESFCFAAAEPMACGRPVVATRTGALPEIVVDQLSGCVVEPGNPLALASAIARYRDDSATRYRHGQQARMDAERRFDIDVVAAAYIDLFRTVVDGGLA